MRKDNFHSLSDGRALGVATSAESSLRGFQGSFRIQVRDSRGELVEERHVPNTPTRDSSILTAMCYGGGATLTPPAVRGITMLAVGTGATGALLSPDAADPRQRKLNAELARKGVTAVTYRDSLGAASAVPTHVVDFTVSFGPNEAVGPLNEMGLVRTLSLNPAVRSPVPAVFPAYDPAVDMTSYDLLVNYSTFSVISIPAGGTFGVTWRLTF